MKIVLYIIWALFVTGATFACVQAVRKTRRQEQLIASWPKVQATVTGSRQGWTSGGGNATRNVRFWPTYQFTDPRGIAFAGESEISYLNPRFPGHSWKSHTTRMTRTSHFRSLRRPKQSSGA